MRQYEVHVVGRDGKDLGTHVLDAATDVEATAGALARVLLADRAGATVTVRVLLESLNDAVRVVSAEELHALREQRRQRFG